ncbi:MAG TPA: prepilin-type N-terminal cleavage/methylation domain-containing protein [Candidatus Omnitrophota bacterium]|nr:prepilin-type N-terminal cleavage/methylation domain-containing protein [Candidatus Omnitrophota bacterium]HPT07902.1 prepilin-type N-terminal cleavage/methylation domain-containing protein [Candidatus Omnitrophota bacterium]
MTNRGFTILEMIMVILVIGILAIVIGTDLTASLRTAKLYATRYRLACDIMYAQNCAVTQQVRHGVIFNPAQNSYAVYRLDNATIVSNPMTQTAFVVNLSNDTNTQDVDILSTSFGAPTTNQIEFDSYGIPYSNATQALMSPGNVTLRLGAVTTVVTVTNTTGKVD